MEKGKFTFNEEFIQVYIFKVDVSILKSYIVI